MTGVGATGAARTLASSPLLRAIGDDGLEAILADASRITVHAGERLFAAGDEADALYVVLSGRLRAVTDGDDPPRVLRELGPGAAVGELALLTGERRSASVVAARDSTLLALDRDRFDRLLAERPGVALGIARELARLLQESGGISVPEPRPRLIGIRAVDGGADVARLARGLEERLRTWGSAAVLDGTEGTVDDAAERIDRAERENAHVVLVHGANPVWDAVCARQADVTLAVATAGAAAPAAAPGDDLVLLGPMQAADVTRVLDHLRPRRYHRLATTEPTDPGLDRLARRLVRRSLGVVFSGGGARGYAHIGVMRAIEEAGLVVDRYGGCSMGAFMAAMGAATWRADDVRARCEEELVRRSPFNDYTVPRVALIRSRKARRMLERLFGEMLIEELPRPLFTITADLVSSTSVVHRRGLVLEAVGASMSIPGLTPPVPLAGRLLVDGAVLNNLPVDVMAESDEGPILAVDVGGRLDGALGAGDGRLPSIVETLSRATLLASIERSERNRALATVLVHPEVDGIALREFGALGRAVQAGYEAGSRVLEGGGADVLRAATSAPVT